MPAVVGGEECQVEQSKLKDLAPFVRWAVAGFLIRFLFERDTE